MAQLTISQTVLAFIIASLSYFILRVVTLKPFEPLPIIGHFWHYGLRDRYAQAEWVLEAQKYFKGKTWFLSIPGIIPKAWMMSDPACIKYVTLNKHLIFNKKGYFDNCTRELFGDGVVIATGEDWHAQRNAAHVFTTADTLEILTNRTLPRHLNILTDTLHKAAETGEVVDMTQVVTHFIFAVFGDIAWDVSWEEIKPLSEVYDSALEVISWRYGIPAFRFWERIFPHGARLRKDLKIIRGGAKRLVDTMKAKMREEEMGGNEINPESGLLVRGLLKENMSDELMIDACITFASAGRGATSHSIVWGLYELINNPRYVEALRWDIDKLPHLSLPTLVKEVPLLEHVVSETARFHPSIPFEVAELQPGEGNVVLPDGTVVEPGTIMFWCSWAINRNKGVFGPDAEEFRPGRWAEMDKRPSAYEMPTFNSGPRSCPGQQMARLEMAYVFTEIFKRYDLEAAWEGRKVLDEGTGGEMKGGLPVRVKKRSV